MNTSFIRLLQIVVILLMLSFSISSCEKEPVNQTSDELTAIINYNKFIYKTMVTDKIYFWYDKMTVNQPENYSNSDEYLYSMLYKDLDRWSFSMTLDAYNSHYVEGKFYGFGFGSRWDENNQLRISYVIPNSPIERAGVKRGYILKEVAGKSMSYILNNNLLGKIYGANQAGVTIDFKFETPEGEIVSKSITKAEVSESPVQYTKIFDVAGKKVGYVVFTTFIQTAINQLDEAFAQFAEENVSYIVFDLRYNTGGSVSVAEHIGNLMLGNENTGKLFYTHKHNTYIEQYDKNYLLTKVASGINVDKVAFITSKLSASASELLINCVEPYVKTAIIGGDTYGKPVGMYGYEFEDYMLFPVSFKTINSEGLGDYYNGLTANAYRRDGLNFDFGDTNEDCLKEALYWLEHGNFSDAISKKSARANVPYLLGEYPENPLKAMFLTIENAK